MEELHVWRLQDLELEFVSHTGVIGDGGRV